MRHAFAVQFIRFVHVDHIAARRASCESVIDHVVEELHGDSLRRVIQALTRTRFFEQKRVVKTLSLYVALYAFLRAVCRFFPDMLIDWMQKRKRHANRFAPHMFGIDACVLFRISVNRSCSFLFGSKLKLKEDCLEKTMRTDQRRQQVCSKTCFDVKKIQLKIYTRQGFRKEL